MSILPRIALVGAGMVGRRHAQALKASNRAIFSGIADPTNSARSLAIELGVPHFDDVDALVAAQKPDGAILAVPTQLHCLMGEALARKGIHLLVEKPVADTLESGQRLVDTAAQSGVKIMIGHHRRFHSATRAAKAIIDSGELGRLVAVNVTWAVLKQAAYYDVAWRREKGAGPILTNLIHDIDLLRCFCGEFETISAITSNAVRGFVVEDTVAASFSFHSGTVGTLVASDATPSPWAWDLSAHETAAFPQADQNSFKFLGTKGTLDFPVLKTWSYPDPSKQGWIYPLEEMSRKVAYSDPLDRQIDHFVDVIQGKAEPLVSGEEGLRTLVATLAIIEAGRTGETIRL